MLHVNLMIALHQLMQKARAQILRLEKKVDLSEESNVPTGDIIDAITRLNATTIEMIQAVQHYENGEWQKIEAMQNKTT